MTESDGTIDARLVDCFTTVFPSLTPEEIATLDHATYDEWDSLASISLVTVIEEEFDLALDDETIGTMTTFGRTAAAVKQLLGA